MNVTKSYTYNNNGKEITVIRNYEVKHPDSYKNKANKQRLDNYIIEKKDEILAISPCHRTTYIIDLANNQHIKLSRTAANKLLTNLLQN